MNRYYSIHRPVGPGTFPKAGAQEIQNYDDRTYVAEIGREAWGHIGYDRELTEKEMADYELVKSLHSNMDRLKHAVVDFLSRTQLVYIPIWID